MKNRDLLMKLLLISVGAVTGTALANQYIIQNATRKNILKYSDSLCYPWRLGNIHYSKTGTGKPLLLIHDMNAASSSYEWSRITEPMSHHFTVYTIDLLGFGCSDKPNLTYTNFLFVQLLTDFIHDIIQEPVKIIATGDSGSVALMATLNDTDLLESLILINPESLISGCSIPSQKDHLFKWCLDLPVLGTMLYHIASSQKILNDNFVKSSFYNPYTVPSACLDAYYEAAHLGESPKSIYGSIVSHYVKCNVVSALEKTNLPIYLIGGESVPCIANILKEYKDHNPSVEYCTISQSKRLPQLEAPIQLCEQILTYIC